MKNERKKEVKIAGFTIIELLTVMSIIILLISLLVPALTRVRRYAQFVKQKAQFHAMSIALDLFNSEQGNYPPSDRLDTSTLAGGPFAYCGAMKLAEAMVGKDLRGFDPNSIFRRDGLDATGITAYPQNPGSASALYPDYIENIKSRKMYLQLENANATFLTDIYTSQHLTSGTAPFVAANNDPCLCLVLCDVYTRSMATGKKSGMPVLYYKADTSKVEHDAAKVMADYSTTNIYNRWDNQELVDIPLPWVATFTATNPVHPMASVTGGTTQLGVADDPAIFYHETKDPKVTTGNMPYRADSYILMSAGYDGEYGTKDDVFNFGE